MVPHLGAGLDQIVDLLGVRPLVLEGRLQVKRDLEAEREEIAALVREEAEWRAAQSMRLRAERQEALVDLESFVGEDVDEDDFDDDHSDLN